MGEPTATQQIASPPQSSVTPSSSQSKLLSTPSQSKQEIWRAVSPVPQIRESNQRKKEKTKKSNEGKPSFR